jgi:hypothetical protein
MAQLCAADPTGLLALVRRRPRSWKNEANYAQSIKLAGVSRGVEPAPAKAHQCRMSPQK